MKQPRWPSQQSSSRILAGSELSWDEAEFEQGMSRYEALDMRVVTIMYVYNYFYI